MERIVDNNDFSEEKLESLKENTRQYRELMSYYGCAMLEIETKFRVLNLQFSLEQDHNPIETIKTRLKSAESIIGKLKRRNLPMNVEAIEENLNDVAGVRVICPFISDIYMLADCLLEQDDVKLIEKKDYIRQPKENGYRSLHLIVETPIYLQDEKKYMRVEVQLRTIAMDFWASLEHRLRYKKEINPQVLEMLAVELKECADDSASLDKRMETVRDYIEQNGTRPHKYSKTP